MADVGDSGSLLRLSRRTRRDKLTLLLCKRGSVQILRVPLNVPLTDVSDRVLSNPRAYPALA
jgi:hypothetical protein